MPVAAASHPEISRTRVKVALPLAALLLLGGCAGGKVENLFFAPVHAPAPTTLRIEVSLAPDLQETPAADKVAQTLETDLVKRYNKAGLAASPALDGAPSMDGATLHVRINRVDPGNPVARLVVGFGAGRSSLRADTSLDLPGAGAALSFSSSTDSGRKPGLILPGGVAAATGNLTHLAIGGGLDLLLAGRGSLSHDADNAAKLIVGQTHKLYSTSGWAWPTPRRT